MTHYDIHADAYFHDRIEQEAGKTHSVFVVLKQIMLASLRFVLFGISSLLQRPLASLVMTLCLWGLANASLGLMHQTRHHPAPMFQNKAFAQSPQKSVVVSSAVFSAPAVKAAKTVDAPHQDIDPILALTVQNRLRELGYNCGDEEGVVGAKTRAAIGKFEQVSGLPVTGAFSAAFLKKLNAVHKAH